jgi:hypothetical protein
MDANKKASDGIMANTFDRAGNIVSGLNLEPIGEDGHYIANKLWKIARYLRDRKLPTCKR